MLNQSSSMLLNGHLNPSFDSLKTFVEEIPQLFEHNGETIYKERNHLKRYVVNGLSIVVKRFCVPNVINRVAYVYLRPSKAKRAYYNGLEILKRGYNTPVPIAYLESRNRANFLGFSYFISLEAKAPYQVRIINNEPIQQSELLAALGKYVGELQNAAIFHEDLSPGNILYRNEPDGSYYFELCDINRMSFPRTIDAEKGIENLNRLLYNMEAIQRFSHSYCMERKLDYKQTVEQIDRAVRRFWMPKWRKIFR